MKRLGLILLLLLSLLCLLAQTQPPQAPACFCRVRPLPTPSKSWLAESAVYRLTLAELQQAGLMVDCWTLTAST
jgi:hypothetical protein